MPDIVPTRITINFDTLRDPVTHLPIVTLAVSMAQVLPDGIYQGVGTVPMQLSAAQEYAELDPITRQPLGKSVTGEEILAILLGVAAASQGA